MNTSKLYCKINENYAKSELFPKIRRIIDEQPSITEFEAQKIFGDWWPIAFEQIKIVKKIKRKLPTWYKNNCFASPQSLEQATAEIIAMEKAKLIAGNSVFCATGGLGVDDFACSIKNKTVISIDPDEGLNAIVQYNSRAFELNNFTRITDTAENFLANTHLTFDSIYLDPDRRQNTERKIDMFVFEPNVFDLYAKFYVKAKNWYIKFSPMNDISQIVETFNCNCKTIIFAEKNEVKELFVELNTAENTILIMDVFYDKNLFNKHSIIGEVSSKKYFIEPSNAVLKSGFYRSWNSQFNLENINKNKRYFIGNYLLFPVFGKSREIVEIIEGSLNQMKETLKVLTISAANISSSDYDVNAEEIRKFLQIKDSSELHLFFTKNLAGKKVCIITKN